MAPVAPIPRPLEQLSPEELDRKRAIIRLSTAAHHTLTDHFLRHDFAWMLPVVFSQSTDPLWPDPGASIEKRLEVEIYEETVRATLSMIIHKMVACSLLTPRLFLLSPNVRIERRERGGSGIHTYEFTQLDFEWRDASSAEVRSLVEDGIQALITHLLDTQETALDRLGQADGLRVPKTPFPVHDREDLEAAHGGDWEAALVQTLEAPAWVTNIPREFYDFEDPGTGAWDNYDLFVPRVGEILSGARREWEYDRIREKMERDEIDPGRYELVLSLAKAGRLRPSAGAGIGIERLLGWVSGVSHIGEVQPFPKVPGTVYEL